MLKRKKGFTLLELMIVVIIIGILATLALPRFLKATKSARWAAAAQTLSIIRSAQMRYYAEYDEWAADVDNTDGSTDLDIGLEDSTDWNITDPTSPVTDAEIGTITHIGTGDPFAIASDGTITPTKDTYTQ